MSQLVLPFLSGPQNPEPAKAARAPAASRAFSQRQTESALVVSPVAPRALLSESAKPKAPRVDLFLSAAQVLAEKLERDLDESVEVELTDNAWTMVSYKRLGGQLRFRLHHMFCSAPEEVVRALAGFTGRARKIHGRTIDAFIRNNRELIKTAPTADAKALQTQGEVHDLAEMYSRLNAELFGSRIDAFIRKNRELIKTAPTADAKALQTQGEVHDLAEMYSRLNAELFGSRIDALIGWGRRAPDRRRRSIKMGVYLHDQRLIRIHPALDDNRVPALFVELVVFHEMLHQAIPPSGGDDGRRCVHGPEFRAAERRFPGFEEARAWEKSHLHLLLRKSL